MVHANDGTVTKGYRVIAFIAHLCVVSNNSRVRRRSGPSRQYLRGMLPMASRLQRQTLHPATHGTGWRDDLGLGCRVRGRYVIHLKRGYLRQIANDLLRLLAILRSRE